ncbi:hypothetical protein Q9233_001146 [Columba guinea]|nr:hypothetical protein Q9233_001146 [Columba guinea]
MPGYSVVVLWDVSQHEEKLQNVKPVADGTEITAVSTVNASILNKLQCIYMSVGKNGGTHGYELVPDVNMKKGIGQQNVVVGLVVWVEFVLAKENQMDTTSENRAETFVQLVTCSPDCSILFWNNPAMKSSSEKLKEEDIFGMPFDVPDTSKHLDLCWKPLVKVL